MEEKDHRQLIICLRHGNAYLYRSATKSVVQEAPSGADHRGGRGRMFLVTALMPSPFEVAVHVGGLCCEGKGDQPLSAGIERRSSLLLRL